MPQKQPAVSGVTGRIQSDGKFCSVDAHGDINIFGEIGWSNVKIVNLPHSVHKQLQGLNLNCLLRGLFILYGFEDLDDNALPGGFNCWEVLLESFFISITHFCSIDEILRRIQHLVFIFIHDSDASCSVDGDNNAVGNILYGAFSFLMFWILSFSSYLSDSDLTRLRAGIHGLGNQFNEPREELDKKNRYGYNYIENLEKCRSRYDELHKITHEVVQNRLFKTIGLTRNTATGGNVSIVHNQFAQPNVSQSVGTWAGYEVAINKEKLKTTLASTPQLKLEIFGAETLFDDTDEDEDDNRGRGGGGGDTWGRDLLPTPPTVRVAPGTSLLREPYALSVDIFTIDILELARQWTLADHALFCSIPLHSLMPPPGSNTSISGLARSQQTRLGLLGRGTFGGALALADRFAAMSTWVTKSILSNADVQSRSAKITFFIRLAGHMAELSNFNGLMSILTALAQGCIKRLQLSFEGVPKADRVKYAQLQNMMALPKNYQKYRLEVTKLSVHFDFADDMSTFARSDGGKNSPRSQSGELVWRREILMRYKPSAAAAGQSSAAKRPAAPSSSSSSSSAAHALMRSNSMNNMMTRSTSLDSPDTIWSEHFEAIVPYLGVHSGELTTICDGNGDYLTDRPYLFNTHKMALLAGTLSLLLKMQRLEYNLTPVRSIVAALNFAAKPHLHLSAAAYAENSKRMHELSLAVEPVGMQLLEAESGRGSGSTLPVGRTPGASGSVLQPGTPTGRQKYRKSAAYNKLTGKVTTADDDEEEEEEESEEDTESDISEDDDAPKKVKSLPYKLFKGLKRAFSTKKIQ